MAGDLRKLLEHIVRSTVVPDELISIDQDASASDAGESIENDKQRAARRELERADDLADAFARGLVMADDGVIVLDDRNPDENRVADALVHFLVRTDLATSRAVETEPQHYRYRIVIDWQRLDEVARAAGVDLEAAVKRAS